ncbi:hypothetical protein MMC28_011679 [Mycoblastus sanguinarius]|nr:hypothetical protein [Mycoblastus sanguinarius]
MSSKKVGAKKKYDLDSFSTIARIIVGPEKQLFQIHKDLLCNVSTYFNAALNGQFKEV